MAKRLSSLVDECRLLHGWSAYRTTWLRCPDTAFGDSWRFRDLGFGNSWDAAFRDAGFGGFRQFWVLTHWGY